MNSLVELTNFAGASLAVTVVPLFARWALMSIALRTDRFGKGQEQQLRPAELAYLMRKGDMSNVVAVLSFDLLHRATKSGLSGHEPFDLAPYETSSWQKAKDYVRSWKDDQVGKVLPDLKRETIQETTKKISAIYRFLTTTLRAFAQEVTADPRRIKRYISFSGVARLVADLGSAGYQQVLKAELAADLLSRGLLIPPEKCQRWSMAFDILAGAAGLTSICLALAYLPDRRLAIACVILAAFNAAALRLFLFFLDLVPWYSELRDVLAHLNRQGWRIKLFRLMLRLISIMVAFLLLFAIALFLLIESAAVNYALATSIEKAAVVLLLTTANMFIAFKLLSDGNELRRRPQPSLSATALIGRERAKLSRLSPLETFKQVLASPEYEPEFSKLLAIYGIETLWLLA